MFASSPCFNADNPLPSPARSPPPASHSDAALAAATKAALVKKMGEVQKLKQQAVASEMRAIALQKEVDRLRGVGASFCVTSFLEMY